MFKKTYLILLASYFVFCLFVGVISAKNAYSYDFNKPMKVVRLEYQIPADNGDLSKEGLIRQIWGYCKYYQADFEVCEKIIQVIDCESKFNPEALNPYDPTTRSVGLAQFKDRTFNYFANYYGLKGANIENHLDQIRLMVLMFNDNLGYHWSCY